MLARRKAIAGAGSEPDIFRAQRSFRSIRLGLGVATVGILATDHADCADILPKCGNVGDVEMKPGRGSRVGCKETTQGDARDTRATTVSAFRPNRSLQQDALNESLLHDRGNMQAGYVSMAVVVRKNDDVAAPRMYRCMVRGGC